jgi:hypothetical protein
MLYVFFLDNSPPSEFYIPTFRNTLFHLHRRVGVETYLHMKMEQSVPKRHTKFRRRGITQKKTQNIRRKFEIKNSFDMCVRARLCACERACVCVRACACVCLRARACLRVRVCGVCGCGNTPSPCWPDHRLALFITMVSVERQK